MLPVFFLSGWLPVCCLTPPGAGWGSTWQGRPGPCCWVGAGEEDGGGRRAVSGRLDLFVATNVQTCPLLQSTPAAIRISCNPHQGS
jgi:hypothetical protein